MVMNDKVMDVIDNEKGNDTTNTGNDTNTATIEAQLDSQKNKKAVLLHVKCDRSVLSQKLALLKGLIQQSALVEYKSVLFEVLKGSNADDPTKAILQLTVFDTVTMLSVSLEVQLKNNCNCVGFKTLIPGQFTCDLIDRMDNKEVTLKLKGGDSKIEIEGRKGNIYKLPVLNSERYFLSLPSNNNSSSTNDIEFRIANAEELLEGIEAALPFVSKDDTKYTLCGICFGVEIDNNSGNSTLELAATDGRNLCIYQKIKVDEFKATETSAEVAENLKTGARWILPTKGMQELAKIIEATISKNQNAKGKKSKKSIGVDTTTNDITSIDDGNDDKNDDSNSDRSDLTDSTDNNSSVDKQYIPLLLRISEGFVTITTTASASNNNFVFTSRVIDGHYPQYRKLVPDSFTAIVKFRANEFLKALNRLSALAGDLERKTGIFVYVSFDELTGNENNAIGDELPQKALTLQYKGEWGEGTETIEIESHFNSSLKSDKEDTGDNDTQNLVVNNNEIIEPVKKWQIMLGVKQIINQNVKTIGGKEVLLMINDPFKPMMLRPAPSLNGENEHIIQILAPSFFRK